MSRHSEKEWTAGRIIAVGLFTLCVGALIHQGTGGGATLSIVGAIIAFFLAGAISDPNASKGDVVLRSTTRDCGPIYDYAVVRVDPSLFNE